MTRQERMALALAYQQRNRPNLGDLSPEQVTAMQAPTQQPTMSLLDRISETGAGIGKGLANTVESMGQMVTAPIETGKEMYRNVSDVVSNPSLIVDALKQMGEKATSSPAGFGEVVGENINPRNLAKTLAKGLAKPVMQELIVAHGTPHRFPPTANNPLGEFDASKIGTGEGAQSYGHGIYLAESPDVAKSYMTAGGSGEMLTITPKSGAPIYGNALTNTHLEAIKALEMGEKDAGQFPHNKVYYAKQRTSDPVVLEMIDKIKDAKIGYKSHKSLYTVDLPDEKIAQMLDLDKPLGQQPKAIRDAINRTKALLPDTAMADLGDDLSLLYGKDVTPSSFLNTWEALTGSTASGEAALQKHGIPGIKYLDAGSRDSGKGTRNFVVFPGEEKHLKILERK